MAGDKKQKLALKVSNTIKKYLDSQKWRYSVSNDQLGFSFGITTDRLPFQYQISVSPESESVYLSVGQDLVVPHDKRIAMAYALCAVNDYLVDGCFDYSVSEGKMSFRVVVAYGDAEFGATTVEYMINVAYSTLNKLNDAIVDYVEDRIDQREFLGKML